MILTLIKDPGEGEIRAYDLGQKEFPTKESD